MYFYLVWVRSNRYHGSTALTYQSDQRLTTGSIVGVELQRALVLGVITGTTTKPRFKTKAIARAYDLPPVPAHLVRLCVWLQQYYPAPLGIVTQQMLPAALADKHVQNPKSEARSPKPVNSALPPLTPEQQAALDAMESRDTYLLHGATGSGKTRIYIELALRAVADGKSAIILTPEISLTAQLAGSFREIFDERVVVLHSQQTPAERQKAWLQVLRSTEPLIIVGPRSALFSPVQKVGLIVLDEAHETAYKQEQAPQYQTGRVASYLTQLTRASLVLGSATPSVSDYYLAEQKGKSIIRLTELAQSPSVILNEREGSGNNPGILPRSFASAQDDKEAARDDRQKTEVIIVDRKDHNLFSRSSYMSQPMIKAVETALSRSEQSLLYLNRRGTARMVMCEDCGWQAACPRDDIPLAYHGDRHELRCHSCGYHDKAPSSCPACKHPNVIFKTAGTKAIADEVQKLFPGARIARFDTDNAKADRFEQQYEAVKKGDVDILVGTQLLAKGLDLPKLSTLGILLADTSLYMPDYSAQERTFQLISQVLGRVGRGHVAGKAIIQTYHPDHPLLTAAIADDYDTFYKTELENRKLFLFPPFCYLLKLSVRRASSKSAEAAAEKLKEEIEASGYKLRVEGPAPSFYERFQNKYQWQLVIKSKDRNALLKIIANLPANWSYDIDPLDLL